MDTNADTQTFVLMRMRIGQK